MMSKARLPKPTVSRLLRVVCSQLGAVEQGGPHGDDGNITKYGAAYGLNGVAWCAIFVWWCFKQVGLDLRVICSKYFAGVVPAVSAWASEGHYRHGTLGIRPGDEAYFAFPGGDSIDHTGIVEKVDRDGIHTIEGNTTPAAAVSDPNGGGVYRRLRPLYEFAGYARVPGLRYDLKARVRHAVQKTRASLRAYPTLRPGSAGAQVSRLQQLLNVAGDHLRTDGTYGPQTEAAVRLFQRNNRLLVDGVAGPKTLADLHF
jgi:hypothetical protein